MGSTGGKITVLSMNSNDFPPNDISEQAKKLLFLQSRMKLGEVCFLSHCREIIQIILKHLTVSKAQSEMSSEVKPSRTASKALSRSHS